jgi:hypothetical protein
MQGQTLSYCVIPAGGLSLDHTHWVKSRRRSFREVALGDHTDTEVGFAFRSPQSNLHTKSKACNDGYSAVVKSL